MAERKKGKGSRRSRHEWQSLLAKLDGSDLGVDAFCRREAISAASLYAPALAFYERLGFEKSAMVVRRFNLTPTTTFGEG